MLKRRDEKTVAKVIPNHNHSLLNKIGSRLGATMDRRAFLKRSGIGVGAGAVAGSLPFGMVRKAEAAAEGGAASGAIEIKRTICTHCSVGCATNGVWVRQNPVFESPITWAPIAPRVLHCVNTATASIA
jgi:formate dehydrogenase major subunit